MIKKQCQFNIHLLDIPKQILKKYKGKQKRSKVYLAEKKDAKKKRTVIAFSNTKS